MLGGVGFLVAFAWQMAVRRYIAWIYWLLVVMVSIFGTMVADVTHIVLGVPYWLSSAGFAVALAVIFTTWARVEGTLSIHSVRSVRRELFYWAAVIVTFALGTATGDMTATTLGLGYFASGLLFAGLFALPALGYWRLGFSEVFAFWFAYVMTRPLGASFADWVGKPVAYGGLGYGTGIVSLALTAAIVVLVAYLAITQLDVIGEGAERPAERLSPARLPTGPDAMGREASGPS